MTERVKGRILVVDDERSMREMLEIFLKREGYSIRSVGGVVDAIGILDREEPVDLVVSDINMPGLTGIDLLREIGRRWPDLPVIMITAYGSPDSAVEAMKLGAADYITKPFRVEEIKARISAAVERRRLAEQNAELVRLLSERYRFENIVGRSESMQRVFEVVRRVSDRDSTVVITGESGTGKELIARALHFSSGTRKGPFVSVNCGALVETLLESELFGHRKGSFTGANADRQGLFETAADGTLFLDEITETSPALQVKLLRAVQEREVVPVGDTRPRKVNARIVAATNRDLAAEVRAGRFREDLFYRLNVISIFVPPLRERREDIPLLVEHFLEKLGSKQGRHLATVSPEAMGRLMSYHFPGNVRELENIVERAAALSVGETLTEDLLPADVLSAPIPSHPPGSVEGKSLDQMVEAYERGIIAAALEKAGGNRTKAAELLGVTFRSLRYRLNKYGYSEEQG